MFGHCIIPTLPVVLFHSFVDFCHTTLQYNVAVQLLFSPGPFVDSFDRTVGISMETQSIKPQQWSVSPIRPELSDGLEELCMSCAVVVTFGSICESVCLTLKYIFLWSHSVISSLLFFFLKVENVLLMMIISLLAGSS